jgi:transposase InsO family protein
VDDNAHATLAAGTSLVYEGQRWEVAELTPPSVLLSGATGELRRVSIGHLLAAPGAQLQETSSQDRGDSATTRLAGLGRAELAQLRERVAHVREACTGYRSGSPELALPGEPRPQYAPGTGMLHRYQAKAAELGIGVRTLRRWAASLDRDGPAGLVDARRLRRRAPESKSTPAFGNAKAGREIAGRPATPHGRLRATRPGEYLLLDTTRLDMFAMDQVTLRWVQAELSVGMDLYDRCITGLRLTPVSTKAIDAAAVLFESVRPLPEPPAGWVDIRPPYHGLPGQVIVDAAKLANESGQPLLPSVTAETIVVDHSKIHLSEHLMSACARLGISVQPARVRQGTGQAALKRFFGTLTEQVLGALPGYKGPDVYRRGKNPEQHSFYFLDELERIIRQWTVEFYHRQPHPGLCVPEVPGLEICPLEMFAHGIVRAGYLQVPARSDLAFDFLTTEWRAIQHNGVEIGGLRYDGPALNPYRNRTSPYTGKHAGRWPLRVDPGDVSKVFFQDPAVGSWHTLRWEHADAVGGPFSNDALAYARQLAAATHRFPDFRWALAVLLEQWGAGLAGDRVARRLALRLSAQRQRLVPSPRPGGDKAQEDAAAPDPGGDDDCDGEFSGPLPGEASGDGPGDFAAAAVETG